MQYILCQQEEHSHICALQTNGYLKKFVEKSSHVCPSMHSKEDSSPKKAVAIPYIIGLSEAIRRVLSRWKLRSPIGHAPHWGKKLVHFKNEIPLINKSNGVYCIPCTTCPAVYIGQTSRHLETRLKEHMAVVKYEKTGLSSCWTCVKAKPPDELSGYMCTC